MPDQPIEINPKYGLKPCSEIDLNEDQCFRAFQVFKHMARKARVTSALRESVPAGDRLQAVLDIAAQESSRSREDAKKFFATFFKPFTIELGGNKKGFVTGYYEPNVLASFEQTSSYSYPIISRPIDDRKRLRSRAEIDSNIEDYHAIAWVRDPIEAFMIQVQGSATLNFISGERQRLVFDGRNGHLYSSIGRLLIEFGKISLHSMSIGALKDWVRRAGQSIGEEGRNLLWRNESYVFFKLTPFHKQDTGPIGGAGVSLTPFVSLATDRKIWPYATPFIIRADLSSVSSEWSDFQRIMVSQDTGAAIRGPARGDIFFGTGEEAGKKASLVRHEADFVVLLPR